MAPILPEVPMYGWLVTLHLLGLVLFLVAHGVSIFVAFRVRGERRRDVVAALLELSRRGAQVTYVGLALLGVGGIGAAWSAGILTAPWVVMSYAIVVVVLVVMFAIASPYYHGLRAAIAGSDVAAPIGDEALDRTLRTRRPELLATIGGVAIASLTAIMTLKPGWP